MRTNTRALGMFAILIGVILILMGAIGVEVSQQNMTVIDFPLVHLETETDAGAIRLLLIVVGAILTFAGFSSQGIKI